MQINNIKLNHIWQTDIDDASADKLCMWLCEIFMGWSYAYKANRAVVCPDLGKINELKNEAIARVGLAKLDNNNSKDGYVLDHEINFQLAGGPKGYTKIYEYFNKAGHEKVVNLLQWGVLVELRDEGKHSLLANGSYIEEGTTYLSVVDPWPKTDDKRFNCDTYMSQRKVGDKWVDSRSIECFAWYRKNDTDWI